MAVTPKVGLIWRHIYLMMCIIYLYWHFIIHKHLLQRVTDILKIHLSVVVNSMSTKISGKYQSHSNKLVGQRWQKNRKLCFVNRGSTNNNYKYLIILRMTQWTCKPNNQTWWYREYLLDREDIATIVINPNEDSELLDSPEIVGNFL